MAKIKKQKTIESVGATFTVIGDTGLRRTGGRVREELLPDLTGSRGILLYSEMRDNHPIIGGFRFAIDMLVRGVKWNVESASSRPEDLRAADFVSSCIDDMRVSWQDTLSEIFSFLDFGFSYHEINYKLRGGSRNPNPLARSRYDDNLIGWDGFAPRSQDSFDKWEFDDLGEITGMWQRNLVIDGRNAGHAFIPMSKALHFKTKASKGNPHGRSILRNAVTSYLTQRRIKAIESIGIERDLAGYPVMRAPAKIMGSQATPDEKIVAASLRSAVGQIRRDESEGLLLPSDTDEKGNKLYEFELVTSGGNRQFDTNAIVRRYDQDIAMTVLADFMMLGHSETGTYSLAENKTNLFARSVGTFLDIVAETINRKAIPDLMELNGFQLEETPRLMHGDIEERDLVALGNYLASLAAAGMPLFPDPVLEQFVRQQANIPEPSVDDLREIGTGSGDRVDDKVEQATTNEQSQAAAGTELSGEPEQ